MIETEGGPDFLTAEQILPGCSLQSGVCRILTGLFTQAVEDSLFGLAVVREESDVGEPLLKLNDVTGRRQELLQRGRKQPRVAAEPILVKIRLRPLKRCIAISRQQWAVSGDMNVQPALGGQGQSRVRRGSQRFELKPAKAEQFVLQGEGKPRYFCDPPDPGLGVVILRPDGQVTVRVSVDLLTEAMGGEISIVSGCEAGEDGQRQRGISEELGDKLLGGIRQATLPLRDVDRVC